MGAAMHRFAIAAVLLLVLAPLLVADRGHAARSKGRARQVARKQHDSQPEGCCLEHETDESLGCCIIKGKEKTISGEACSAEAAEADTGTKEKGLMQPQDLDWNWKPCVDRPKKIASDGISHKDENKAVVTNSPADGQSDKHADGHSDKDEHNAVGKQGPGGSEKASTMVSEHATRPTQTIGDHSSEPKLEWELEGKERPTEVASTIVLTTSSAPNAVVVREPGGAGCCMLVGGNPGGAEEETRHVYMKSAEECDRAAELGSELILALRLQAHLKVKKHSFESISEDRCNQLEATGHSKEIHKHVSVEGAELEPTELDHIMAVQKLELDSNLLTLHSGSAKRLTAVKGILTERITEMQTMMSEIDGDLVQSEKRRHSFEDLVQKDRRNAEAAGGDRDAEHEHQ